MEDELLMALLYILNVEKMRSAFSCSLYFFPFSFISSYHLLLICHILFLVFYFYHIGRILTLKYMSNVSCCRYLTGHQLAGESSVEGYISALKRGCRVVERKWSLVPSWRAVINEQLPSGAVINIVFWLGSDKLLSCFFARFSLFSPNGSITGCDSSLGNFCYFSMLLNFAFMHLSSGY